MLRRRDLRELPTVLVRMGVVGGAKLPLYFVASLYRIYEYMYILEKGGGGWRGRDTQSGLGSRGLSSILQAIAQTRRLGNYWRCFMFISFFFYILDGVMWTHVSMKFPPSS